MYADELRITKAQYDIRQKTRGQTKKKNVFEKTG